MKKIILVSDGTNFSNSLFNFLRAMYENEPFLLTGAFFHSVNMGLVIPNTFSPDPAPYLTYTKEEHERYTSVIETFKSQCARYNMDHVVHEEGEFWQVEEIVKESRFSDLLVVNGQDFFSDMEDRQPNEYLTEVLRRSEAPVLVVPEDVQAIEAIAIAYDGSRESMFAIKAFTNMFPSLCELPATIYYWVENTDDEIPDLDFIEEYAGRHFLSLDFRELFFDSSKYLVEWSELKPDVMFVCGAYHRSVLSTFFRKSFAHELIRSHISPVFIAHSV